MQDPPCRLCFFVLCICRARCPHRAAGWLFSQGSFAACGRRVPLPTAAKEPKRRRGTAQDGHFVSIFALPPVHHYGGRVLVRFCSISGAQNLSGDLRFLPGRWALGLQKLPLVRFHTCAWVSRTNAPGRYAVGPVWDRPLRIGGRDSAPARQISGKASVKPQGRPLRSPGMDTESGFGPLCRGGCQPPASLPPPRGPTPLIKGRCRAATEGIGTGAPEGGG